MSNMAFARQAVHRAVSNRAANNRGEPNVVHWLDRIRGEYLEMPGLSLTERQAERLWGLDSGICDALLGALTQCGFLRRIGTGKYILGNQR